MTTRDDFEEWAKSEGYGTNNIDNCYSSQNTIAAWKAWQAATAKQQAEIDRIRAEALQDAAAYVLANAKIKNSCCAETRASIYTLIKGMKDDN